MTDGLVKVWIFVLLPNHDKLARQWNANNQFLQQSAEPAQSHKSYPFKVFDLIWIISMAKIRNQKYRYLVSHSVAAGERHNTFIREPKSNQTAADKCQFGQWAFPHCELIACALKQQRKICTQLIFNFHWNSTCLRAANGTYHTVGKLQIF